MKLLFRKVFEAILCSTSRDSVFTRESSKSTATPNALDNHTQAARHLFWPLLAAIKELSIPQSRSNRGRKWGQNGSGSGRFAHLQQSHCEQPCQAARGECHGTSLSRGHHKSLLWEVRKAMPYFSIISDCVLMLCLQLTTGFSQ